MKKTLIGLAVVLVMGLTATFGYAQTSKATNDQPKVAPKTNVTNEQREERHKEKIEWKRSQLDQAIKDGKITEEQAKTWEEHYNYMEKFHKENGNSMPCGDCRGDGKRGENNGKRSRNGRGLRQQQMTQEETK